MKAAVIDAITRVRGTLKPRVLTKEEDVVALVGIEVSVCSW